MGCPSGVEPESKVPQTSVLTITPWAPYVGSITRYEHSINFIDANITPWVPYITYRIVGGLFIPKSA